ncbi:MAG: hypothetical protein LBQ52_05455, partial [Helicobacteraceae bacterium]|nr:hypothetical protein [Helicobacteraceae bacterium]
RQRGRKSRLKARKMFIFFYLLAAWALWLVATPFLAIAAIFSAKSRSFLFLRMLPFGERSAPFTIYWQIGAIKIIKTKKRAIKR